MAENEIVVLAGSDLVSIGAYIGFGCAVGVTAFFVLMKMIDAAKGFYVGLWRGFKRAKQK